MIKVLFARYLCGYVIGFSYSGIAPVLALSLALDLYLNENSRLQDWCWYISFSQKNTAQLGRDFSIRRENGSAFKPQSMTDVALEILHGPSGAFPPA